MLRKILRQATHREKSSTMAGLLPEASLDMNSNSEETEVLARKVWNSGFGSAGHSESIFAWVIFPASDVPQHTVNLPQCCLLICSL